jgi:hypothetical protein
MSDEATYVLRAVHDELRKHGGDLVGRLELSGDTLTAYDGQMVLRAEVHSDPSHHPSIAHCHLVARIGRTSFSDPLDCCVLGIDADRRRGLAKAGQNWVTIAGSAIFSLLHAKPVMGAVHFDGNDPWGVPGCHGFVGPAFGYGMRSEPDFTPFLNAGVFDYAAAMAPPGIVHIAKAILEARGDQGWSRTLEIDGHLARFEEKNWSREIPAPPAGVASQFAVFHFAGQEGAVETRRSLDEAIREFVSTVATTKDVDAALQALRGKGRDADIVHRMGAFVPLAFFRVMFADIGAKFSPDYHWIMKDGASQTLKLLREPVFARAAALYPQLLTGGHVEAVKLLATYSGAFHALNSALNAGSKPENLVMMPELIPSPDTDAAAIQRAMLQVQASAAKAQRASAAAVRRPWWRFW